MLTWSYDVSDGFPGGIMPISVVLLGKMGQAFFLGNLSVYFNMGYQFLIPSYCWEWAVSGWLGVFAQQQMCGELVANMDEWILSVVLQYLRGWVGCVRVALGWRKRPGLVSFTAHALYPRTLSAHWLLLGKVFCVKLHFQTIKSIQKETNAVISDCHQLQTNLPSCLLLSPEVYLVTSRIPSLFMNRVLPSWSQGTHRPGTTFVGEEEIISPLPFWVLSWDPCNKRLINTRKTNRRFFLTHVLHVCMGDTQGKISKSLRWLRI